MRASSSFTRKLDGVWSKQLDTQIKQFENVFACAGIRNNHDAAMKARGNHYGEYYIDEETGAVKSIPTRRFVWAATHNMNVGNYAELIKKVMVRYIHDHPMPRTQTTTSVAVRKTEEGYEYKQKASNIKKGVPLATEGFFKHLTQQMAANQRDAILNLNFEGKKQNARLTIRRKGFDHPLIDTGKMLEAIQGWEG